MGAEQSAGGGANRRSGRCSGRLTPAPITIYQAVDRALTGNPTLLAARAHVTATRATAVTAGLRQNPTLTLLGQGVTLPEINNDGGTPITTRPT